MSAIGFEMVDEKGYLLVKCLTGDELIKAHVQGYTRKDGTYVRGHDVHRESEEFNPHKKDAEREPSEGEPGYHELKTYGAYHREGSKVKDKNGDIKTVHKHIGPQVLMTDGTWSHHSTVSKLNGKKAA